MGRMGFGRGDARARSVRRRGLGLPRVLTAVALSTALTGAALGTLASSSSATAAPGETSVYLVTLDGPGLAGYHGPLAAWVYRSMLLGTQTDLLDEIGGDAPLYRWTTALNGFAAELTPGQAEDLRLDDRVALVEKNSVRPLAGAPGAGAGLVVGMVDTGLWPESSLFAAGTGLGRPPRGFHGECMTGDAWAPDDCTRKVVGARWFVAGFGEANLRSSSSLSPQDDSGHGTQMASIAAGNAGVSVQVPGQRLGPYGGIAPQARIAVYKACWSAPDPAHDGCATADLVTAIDRATSDGVDVLNLSVGGPSTMDTVERALLGAAEKDVVVIAAAGNRGHAMYAAHPSPWVTSVGGTTGDVRLGSVDLPGGTELNGAMASSRPAGPARLVVGAKVPARGASRAAARICRPGSLDASRTEGAIVLCERGGIGRVVKSQAVDQADGVGMVLANVSPGGVESDLHSVPTVHLTRGAAATLRAWSARHPHGRVTLRPAGLRNPARRVTSWSSSGDPTATLVKPDVVAPAVGILGAVPPTVRGTRWDFVTGTSAATAYTSGLALRLRADHRWSADVVRSALVTSATSVSGHPSALNEGAGLPRLARAQRPGLAYRVGTGDYRAWLGGYLVDELNAPSILLPHDRTHAVRSITNIGHRPATFSVSVTGFAEHQLSVTPTTVRLAPGRTATFRVRATGPERTGPVDDGWITWVSPNGTSARIPVVLTR
jgi:minor extracellular serine protease Vpr